MQVHPRSHWHDGSGVSCPASSMQVQHCMHCWGCKIASAAHRLLFTLRQLGRSAWLLLCFAHTQRHAALLAQPPQAFPRHHVLLRQHDDLTWSFAEQFEEVHQFLTCTQGLVVPALSLMPFVSSYCFASDAGYRQMKLGNNLRPLVVCPAQAHIRLLDSFPSSRLLGL